MLDVMEVLTAHPNWDAEQVRAEGQRMMEARWAVEEAAAPASS